MFSASLVRKALVLVAVELATVRNLGGQALCRSATNKTKSNPIQLTNRVPASRLKRCVGFFMTEKSKSFS